MTASEHRNCATRRAKKAHTFVSEVQLGRVSAFAHHLKHFAQMNRQAVLAAAAGNQLTGARWKHDFGSGRVKSGAFVCVYGSLFGVGNANGSGV